VTRPYVDDSWYQPKFEYRDGYVSAKIGDHYLVDKETVHLNWPSGEHETTKIIMVPRPTPIWLNGKLVEVTAMVPHIKIEHLSAKLLVPLELISGIELRRPGAGKK
jgi:hypothetical protein